MAWLVVTLALLTAASAGTLRPWQRPRGEGAPLGLAQSPDGEGDEHQQKAGEPDEGAEGGPDGTTLTEDQDPAGVEPTEARRLYAELLPDMERVPGADHPNILTTRQALHYWTRQADDGE